jgi:hypothetical protein
MIDRLLQTSRSILRLVFSVRFEGFCQGVGGIVGFAKFGGLDGGGFFEALARFFAGFLHAEGICCLGVEFHDIFIFVASAAEEGEAAAC